MSRCISINPSTNSVISIKSSTKSIFLSDAGVSGATSSQNLSHQQAQHQLGQAIHMPGVTQYVTAMQRPHQVKPVSQNIINPFFF